ncbi:carbohydrate kinase [Paenibacillus hexagrammi]|uniref:Winged helix-turn-helix transcriptional regulator n=1 Tax=Paenibacillus hexagrammi TaxID=2908839 RepID=A0ABY3SIL5_9BACL|nr:carbohydrate kinase [Paenibacillus sp. YPD9-1]UJF32980.1 winged helix-turn-helix transcriptional regulator [Paenibacillus sp. YPD9-1]
MDREQHILSLIRVNPFISQNELANQIGISRSAVAGYIASLTKKGMIRGRAYIIADESSVMCIGGANLDNKAASKAPIRLASSNPVTVTESCGGVARNIAENLAGLGCRSALITAVGDDKAGTWVLGETSHRGVDISQSIVIPGAHTGTYTALLDASGEMFLAFANMDIYDAFGPELLNEKWPHIAASKLVIADTNLPQASLDMLVKRCGAEGVLLFLDPVSSEKAKKLPHDLTGITAIFPNLEEAYELAGRASTGEEADPAVITELAEAIRRRGVQHVFITLGKQGVLYQDEHGSTFVPPLPTDVVEVTGAGDAFVAGVAYGILHDHSYLNSCKLGTAAAHLTLQTNESASSRLTEEVLVQTMQNSFPSEV